MTSRNYGLKCDATLGELGATAKLKDSGTMIDVYDDIAVLAFKGQYAVLFYINDNMRYLYLSMLNNAKQKL